MGRNKHRDKRPAPRHHPVEHTFADIKGRLAALGADVHPDAKMQTLDRPLPGAATLLVVVDRVESVEGKPTYCVHGFTTCINCHELCYLGTETLRSIQEHGASPLCLVCAPKVLPEDARPTGHVQDRLRSEGPHEG